MHKSGLNYRYYNCTTLHIEEQITSKRYLVCFLGRDIKAALL